MNYARLPLLFALLATAKLHALPIDFNRYDPSSSVKITSQPADILRAEWTTSDGGRCATEIDLASGKPLLKSLETSASPGGPFFSITGDVQLRFDVTIGRRGDGGGPYVFFDKVDTRPHARFSSAIAPKRVQVISDGVERARIVISTITAGSFSGDLVLNLYNGSPFIHVDAAMATEQPKVAYIYDLLLCGTFPKIAYKSNTDEFPSERPTGQLAARKVRNRTIMAQFPHGTVAVFPPPHAYIYPMDMSDNLGFVQVGREQGQDLFGLKSQPEGDHRFRPWIDGPAGTTQHMSAFLLLSPTPAADALERVKRYTHGDTFKELPGYVTFANHLHAALTMTEGTSNPLNFQKTMIGLKVKTVEVAEFHGDGNPDDTGTRRLEQLKGMFAVCRKYSVPGVFTLIPGEESNTGFPGHSMYFFPKPVYLTLKRKSDQAYKETLAGYGDVFHVGSIEDMLRVLHDNGGIAWTAHPRTKASQDCPDNFFNTKAFRDDVFSGGDWKSLPLNLSEERLGTRSLKLLDDMNQLGQKKRLIGAVDVFKIDPSHELYAHMNVNYVKSSGVPPASDWSQLHQAIAANQYFTSTGEVLIPSWSASRDRVTADIEWTFPMAFAEVVWGEGKEVKRARFPLGNTKELVGSPQQFSWPVNLAKANWVRLEAWDIARNGAFTTTDWKLDGSKDAVK